VQLRIHSCGDCPPAVTVEIRWPRLLPSVTTRLARASRPLNDDR
jgi:hypothetical protein